MYMSSHRIIATRVAWVNHRSCLLLPLSHSSFLRSANITWNLALPCRRLEERSHRSVPFHSIPCHLPKTLFEAQHFTGTRTPPHGRIIRQCDTGRGPILLGILSHLFLGIVPPAATPGVGRGIRHLQPKTQGAEPLHQNLALIRRDRRDVHRPLGENQRETLVRIGRLALLPQNGRPRKHRILRIGTPRVADLLARAQIQFRGALVGARLPQGGFPREAPSVGVDVQDAQAGLAPAGAAVLDDGDAGAEAGDEAADDEVGGVGAAGGGFEGGEEHGHADFVGLGGGAEGDGFGAGGGDVGVVEGVAPERGEAEVSVGGHAGGEAVGGGQPRFVGEWRGQHGEVVVRVDAGVAVAIGVLVGGGDVRAVAEVVGQVLGLVAGVVVVRGQLGVGVPGGRRGGGVAVVPAWSTGLRGVRNLDARLDGLRGIALLFGVDALGGLGVQAAVVAVVRVVVEAVVGVIALDGEAAAVEIRVDAVGVHGAGGVVIVVVADGPAVGHEEIRMAKMLLGRACECA
mmetsp:Transcript_8362/g.16658  ORF Transcript_8362/g.16658 Transcript_8362/m.16658 type:complete len:514 (-) Transcript_8362:301-1842(-)